MTCRLPMSYKDILKKKEAGMEERGRDAFNEIHDYYKSINYKSRTTNVKMSSEAEAQMPPAEDTTPKKSLNIVPESLVDDLKDTDDNEIFSVFAVNFANSSPAFQTNFPQPGFRILGMFESEEEARAAFHENPPDLETILISRGSIVKISSAGVTDVLLTDVLNTLQMHRKVQHEYPRPLMFPPEASTTRLYNDETFVAIEVIASHVKDEFYMRFVALEQSQEKIDSIPATPIDGFVTVQTGSFYSMYHFSRRAADGGVSDADSNAASNADSSVCDADSSVCDAASNADSSVCDAASNADSSVRDAASNAASSVRDAASNADSSAVATEI